MFDKEKLNQLIKESGKTKTEIAKGLDVCENTLRNWTSGKDDPSLYQLLNIAEYFNIEYTEFTI